MSVALARKYRPKNFASVAVQTHVSKTLRGAIARGRIAHGYLLCGPRGTGKTTLARVLAMALNCERRLSGEIPDEGEPCGECTSCLRIWSGSASLDVVEIDAASNRGVDDARDLRERAMYAPSGEGRYKVYIVDEAHMLTREAWNALLKILEEPPPRVVFVFATTEPQKIAQSAMPVLSRLQRFDLKRIGAAEIRTRLMQVLSLEQVSASADSVAMIARAAEGSMRDALSLADQVLAHSSGELTVEAVRESLGLIAEDEYIELLDIILEHRAADVFPAVARLADEGVDFSALLVGLASTLRGLLAIRLGSEPDDLSARARQRLAERAGKVAEGDVLRMLNSIADLEPRFRRSGQQQLLLETLLVRFALLDRTVRLAELIGGLESSGGPSGGTRAPAPPQADQRRDPHRLVTAAAERPSVGPEVSPPSPRPRELADAPTFPERQVQAQPPGPLDLNRLVELWDEVVDRLRATGRAVLASHFGAALPSAVSRTGIVTVRLDESDPAVFGLAQEALNSAQADLLAILRERFSGVERVTLAPLANAAPASPPASRRLTEEAIKAERLESLRKKDPVLDAAIRELDLELLD